MVTELGHENKGLHSLNDIKNDMTILRILSMDAWLAA